MTGGCHLHASLNVSDLNRSVAFYRAFFNLEPARLRSDYAKFELPDPPLILSLIPGRSGVGSLNHFGLRVADSEALVAIQQRLETAGISTQREEGVACCYSKQTKFWVPDPDRVLWEIYVLHEESDEPDEDGPPEAPKEATAARVQWQHRIGEPLPDRIPLEDHSAHEVLLEGSANTNLGAEALARFLAEAHRVLRPGAELRLHGLTADTPLTEALPSLPGPAAVVEHVPSHAEVVQVLLQAGFGNVWLEKLSATAHFTVSGVSLREIVAVGHKPGHRSKTPSGHAIYLGPMAQVTDDFGNVFPRGESVPLNAHDLQALVKGTSASHFLCLPPKTP